MSTCTVCGGHVGRDGALHVGYLNDHLRTAAILCSMACLQVWAADKKLAPQAGETVCKHGSNRPLECKYCQADAVFRIPARAQGEVD